MSVSQFTRSGLAVAALSTLLGLSLPLTASAQSVTTTPVGAVSKNIEIGLNDFGITLVNPAVAIGSHVSNNQTQLITSGMTNGFGQIDANSSYYLEITSGALAGDRVDIDVAATLETNGSAFVIKTSSPNNTLDFGSSDFTGSTFAIRKHVTLAQLTGSFTPALIANNNPNSADQVWIFDRALSSFISYYLRTDGITWRAVGSSLSANDTIIPPGVGLLIKKRNTASVLTFVGEVRTNDFISNLPEGLSFHAAPYPISNSIADIGGTSGNGWTGNNNPANADQIWIFNPDLQSFTNYYLRSDGTTWRRVGASSPEQDNQLLTFNTAYIISRKTADNGYLFIAPISSN